MKNAIPSIIRFVLSLTTGYLGYIGIESGDLNTVTIGALLGTLVVWGLNWTLKWLDGTQYGTLARVLIGPKVQDLTKSLVRSVVTMLAGATYTYLAMNGEQLEHSTLLEIITLLFAAVFDKKFRDDKSPN